MSEWSRKFTPEPEFYATTQPALLEEAQYLAQLRQTQPKARITRDQGNHEYRLHDMLINHLRAAYDLRPVDQMQLPPSMSVERLLGLHTLGVEYIGDYPNGKTWLNDTIVLKHGNLVRATPGSTANAELLKSKYTSVFGHIHRREMVATKMETRAGHSIHTAVCFGCMCHIDGRVPGSKPSDQWQQGFGIIEYMDDDSDPNFVPIAVDHGTAIYAGKVWRARTGIDADAEKFIKEQMEKIVAGVNG